MLYPDLDLNHCGSELLLACTGYFSDLNWGSCSEGAECRSLVYQAAISTCVLGKRTLVILGGGR
jgi:hypothetical protein